MPWSPTRRPKHQNHRQTLNTQYHAERQQPPTSQNRFRPFPGIPLSIFVQEENKKQQKGWSTGRFPKLRIHLYQVCVPVSPLYTSGGVPKKADSDTDSGLGGIAHADYTPLPIMEFKKQVAPNPVRHRDWSWKQQLTPNPLRYRFRSGKDRSHSHDSDCSTECGVRTAIANSVPNLDS